MTRRQPFTPRQRLKCFEHYGAIVLCQAENCDNAMYIKGCDIDHWLAIVDGGKHVQENFRPLCSSCHAEKSAREHKANCKAKRIASKHSGHEGEAKPMRKRIYSRPLRGRTSWPESSKLQSRPFPKRREAAE